MSKIGRGEVYMTIMRNTFLTDPHAPLTREALIRGAQVKPVWKNI